MKIQDLDPDSAHLCLAVERSCRERLPIQAGQKLLLAVSGGADSIALALIFHLLAPRLAVSLAACCINHKLRPEAATDALFVASFCQRLGLELVEQEANVAELAAARKLGLEEAGRLERLRILEEQRKTTGSDFIVLAHHAGDLAEDILLRLTRGAGWPALGGMAWQNGRFLRPLLHTEPATLRNFLHACGQSWREDASNAELTFKRNRFRHVFLPLFRCENPAVNNSFLKIHEFAQLDADYWEKQLEAVLEANPMELQMREQGASMELARPLLASLHPALRLRLYHAALKKLRGRTGAGGQTAADTLLRLDAAFQSGVGGRIFQCGGSVTARCNRAGVTFRAEAAVR